MGQISIASSSSTSAPFVPAAEEGGRGKPCCDVVVFVCVFGVCVCVRLDVGGWMAWVFLCVHGGCRGLMDVPTMDAGSHTSG